MNRLFCIILISLIISCQCNNETNNKNNNQHFLQPQLTNSSSPLKNTNLKSVSQCIGSDEQCRFEMKQCINKYTTIFDLNIKDYPCLLRCIKENEQLTKVMLDIIQVNQSHPSQDQQTICNDNMIQLNIDLKKVMKSVTAIQLASLLANGDDVISSQIYNVLMQHQEQICLILQESYANLELFFKVNDDIDHKTDGSGDSDSDSHGSSSGDRNSSGFMLQQLFQLFLTLILDIVN